MNGIELSLMLLIQSEAHRPANATWKVEVRFPVARSQGSLPLACLGLALDLHQNATIKERRYKKLVFSVLLSSSKIRELELAFARKLKCQYERCR